MTPRLKILAAIALPLLVSACSTPAQRITSKLTELGVPPRQAQCMGDRLGQRLSLGQLRRVQEIARMNGDRLERMSIREIANTLTDEKDPGLVLEVIRAGIGCTI